jgi:hypothetical protein
LIKLVRQTVAFDGCFVVDQQGKCQPLQQVLVGHGQVQQVFFKATNFGQGTSVVEITLNPGPHRLAGATFPCEFFYAYGNEALSPIPDLPSIDGQTGSWQVVMPDHSIFVVTCWLQFQRNPLWGWIGTLEPSLTIRQAEAGAQTDRPITIIEVPRWDLPWRKETESQRGIPPTTSPAAPSSHPSGTTHFAPPVTPTSAPTTPSAPPLSQAEIERIAKEAAQQAVRESRSAREGGRR